jgi:hypothetical protein
MLVIRCCWVDYGCEMPKSHMIKQQCSNYAPGNSNNNYNQTLK